MVTQLKNMLCAEYWKYIKSESGEKRTKIYAL